MLNACFLQTIRCFHCNKCDNARARAQPGKSNTLVTLALHSLCRPSVDPQKILQRVAKKYGVDRQRLVALGERGLQAKNVAMWMIWESGTKSLREIGELFGGLDYAAVAQRIRRTRSAHSARARSNLINEMLNV